MKKGTLHPSYPKAFGHCRRAPQGEIGKAGRGHPQFSRKTGNPYKIRRPPPCEGEPGCGNCVQGSRLQILYRSDKMTYADMQIYRYADLLLFLGSLMAPRTWSSPWILPVTEFPGLPRYLLKSLQISPTFQYPPGHPKLRHMAAQSFQNGANMEPKIDEKVSP